MDERDLIYARQWAFNTVLQGVFPADLGDAIRKADVLADFVIDGAIPADNEKE